MIRCAIHRPRAWACVGIAAALLLGSAAHARAADLSGCWEGRWVSCTSGHQGRMQATFTRRSATQYDVEFRGTFFAVLPFRYSVTLDVVRDDGRCVELGGDSYLGKMFGTFHYRATADDCNFAADYTSCKDDGRFEMQRVCCPRLNGLRAGR